MSVALRALRLGLTLSLVLLPLRALAAEESAEANPEATELPPGTGYGYTPPEGSGQPLLITGYLDVGFAKAQGDGTSFRQGDTRVPADYGVDTFAPAVNSRGDVASIDSGGRTVNGFLPRSAGIGGQPSFLINTVDLDVRYQAPTAPLLVFTRVQFLPRLTDSGDSTRVLVEQAFGRFIPFDSQEFAVSLGKFDSVFGIEYLENQANLRTNITPSLIARYTTGTSLGVKAFYRYQLPAIWSALSVNLAATAGGPRVEALAGSDASLSGRPVGSGRLGYELNLPRVEVKLGLSGLAGPRNDQRDANVQQRGLGLDGRLVFRGLSLAVEVVRLLEDRGTAPEKVTGAGTFFIASAFNVWGAYGLASYGFSFDGEVLRKLTLFGRYGRRHATFEGLSPIEVDRLTAGLRIDLWENFAAKGEVLVNRELQGAPSVPNDVYTSSFIYSW